MGGAAGSCPVWGSHLCCLCAPPEHLTLVAQFLFSQLPRTAAEGWSQPSLALAVVDKTFVGLQGSLVLF